MQDPFGTAREGLPEPEEEPRAQVGDCMAEAQTEAAVMFGSECESKGCHTEHGEAKVKT